MRCRPCSEALAPRAMAKRSIIKRRCVVACVCNCCCSQNYRWQPASESLEVGTSSPGPRSSALTLPRLAFPIQRIASPPIVESTCNDWIHLLVTVQTFQTITSHCQLTLHTRHSQNDAICCYNATAIFIRSSLSSQTIIKVWYRSNKPHHPSHHNLYFRHQH